MTPRLFHVGTRPVARFVPRPSPAWSSRPGEALVWAVDEPHLWLRLLPRSCHRVHEATTDGHRVVWITSGCATRSADTRLHLHELPSDPFVVEDASAGYWVADEEVAPLSTRPVAPLDELRDLGVVVEVTDDLDAVVADVTARTTDWSVIRAPDVTPW